MIAGSDIIRIIRNTIARPMLTNTLSKVCRIDQAAEMIAPHGPPTAVPAAMLATAFPACAPALTVAAALFATASAPFAAAFPPIALEVFLMACAPCFAAFM